MARMQQTMRRVPLGWVAAALAALLFFAVGIRAWGVPSFSPPSIGNTAEVPQENMPVSALESPAQTGTTQQTASQEAPPAQKAEERVDGESIWIRTTPITFAIAPNSPTTIEERIAAIYLLAAEGKIEEAVALAPAADQADWRKHLQFVTKSTPPTFQKPRGEPAYLPPGSTITITESFKEPNGTYIYNTSLTISVGTDVCVRMEGDIITKFTPYGC